MINRRGLGRGLGALLASEPTESESLLELPIDSITSVRVLDPFHFTP